MRKLFFGGKIMTMASPAPAEAVLVEGETILAVGDACVLRRMAGADVTLIDLQGGTMLPAFTDVRGDLLAAIRARAAQARHGAHAPAWREAVHHVAAQYAAAGVTCLCTALRAADVPLLRRVLHIGFPMPLLAVAAIEEYESVKRATAGLRDGVRLCGVAVVLDTPSDARLRLCDRALGYALHMAVAEGVQPVLYASGEEAIAQALRVVRAYSRVCPRLYTARTVLMGAHALLPTQAAALREAGMLPCFAADALYRYGHACLRRDGISRAARLLPFASVARAGVPLTLCRHDPADAPDPLSLLRCAVRRDTAHGLTLGAGECLTVHEALHALCVSAAWQTHGEWERGCIRAGMRADVVLLDGDPTSCPPARAEDLRVRATFCSGRLLYRAAMQDFSTQSARVPIVY